MIVRKASTTPRTATTSMPPARLQRTEPTVLHPATNTNHQFDSKGHMTNSHTSNSHTSNGQTINSHTSNSQTINSHTSNNHTSSDSNDLDSDGLEDVSDESSSDSHRTDQAPKAIETRTGEMSVGSEPVEPSTKQAVEFQDTEETENQLVRTLRYVVGHRVGQQRPALVERRSTQLATQGSLLQEQQFVLSRPLLLDFKPKRASSTMVRTGKQNGECV